MTHAGRTRMRFLVSRNRRVGGGLNRTEWSEEGCDNIRLSGGATDGMVDGCRAEGGLLSAELLVAILGEKAANKTTYNWNRVMKLEPENKARVRGRWTGP